MCEENIKEPGINWLGEEDTKDERFFCSKECRERLFG